MVWGTYLEKNCTSSNGHILVFGGSKRLPGWFGALIKRRIIQVLKIAHLIHKLIVENNTNLMLPFSEAYNPAEW